MVTEAQVRLLRQKLMEKKTHEAAAASAGMSVRSAQKWQSGSLPTGRLPERSWRTRPDPLSEVWQPMVVPWLESDSEQVLGAKAILRQLDKICPGKYGSHLLRTLQRRVMDWRSLHGGDKEVFFEQVHPVGQEGAFDFTHCKELGVTIDGEPFDHLLFVFTLSCSKWRYVQLAYGETFEALVEGLQGALFALGGAPEGVRSDNLSAATHELSNGRRGLTKKFKAILDHYDLKSTRIHPGKSNENGGAEKSNDLIKTVLRQALVFRGHSDFLNEEVYEAWAREQVEEELNRFVQVALQEEKKQLHALPSAAVVNYTSYEVRVRRWSTIRIWNRTYSVPSRLIGRQVEVRQYAKRIEVYYHGQLTETMPRLRGAKMHRIEYRHIIWSLVRKPGAFAQYRHREELFPTLTFRQAYDFLRTHRGERADVEYVRILHLAASDLQATVEIALQILLERGDSFDYTQVKSLAAPSPSATPVVTIGVPNLHLYDELLTSMQVAV